MKLSRIEWVILALPFLGCLDVISTFYANEHGYPLEMHEGGSFASFFVRVGMLNFYIIIYLAILCGIAGVLIYIKREVASPRLLDKAVFLLLLVTVWILESMLVNTVVSNFVLTYERSVLRNLIPWIVYINMLVVIAGFTWNELKQLLTASSEE
jgi:hypothetical protein